jgi:hypothetical protein
MIPIKRGVLSLSCWYGNWKGHKVRPSAGPSSKNWSQSFGWEAGFADKTNADQPLRLWLLSNDWLKIKCPTELSLGPSQFSHILCGARQLDPVGKSRYRLSGKSYNRCCLYIKAFSAGYETSSASISAFKCTLNRNNDRHQDWCFSLRPGSIASAISTGSRYDDYKGHP